MSNLVEKRILNFIIFDAIYSKCHRGCEVKMSKNWLTSVPKSSSQKVISKGHDLFLELEKKGLINLGNHDYLLDRLLQIAREDLATLLFERILHSSHTALAKLNTMLELLT